MPRKGSISVVPIKLAPFHPPPPPEEFTPQEAAIWNGAIQGMRDSWFTEATFPLLSSYCSICVMAAEVQAELRGMSVTDKAWRGLMRQHRDLIKTMCLAATKLRLCPSSNKSTKNGRRQQNYPKPWEIGDDLA